MYSLLPLLCLVAPTFVAVLCLFTLPFDFLESFYSRIEKESLILGTGLTLVIVMAMVPDALAGMVLETPLLALRFDLTNAAGLLGVAVIFFLTSIYNIKSETGGRLKPSMYNFFVLLFQVCMLGLLLSFDLFYIFVFVELTIGVSIVLVAHSRNRLASESSYKYLIITAISALFVLFAVLVVYVLTGNSNLLALEGGLGVIQENPQLVALLAACFIIGLGADIGLVPFHGWVPDVFPASTPAVNGFFCAEPIAFILALYKLVKPFHHALDSNLIMVMYLGVGAASILFGALMAFSQRDFMRMMAYTSIEGFGHMLLALSLFTPLGFVAGTVYIVNGALMKMGVLLCLGSVSIMYGTNDMDALGGLVRRMRKVALIYVVCVLSVAGVPPLSGFYSKWLLLSAVNEYLLPHGTMVTVLVLGAFVSVSMVSAVYLIRSFQWIFLGRDRDEQKIVSRVPWAMWLPPALVALLAVLIGLQPWLLLNLIGVS